MLAGRSRMMVNGIPLSRIDWRRNALSAVERSIPMDSNSALASSFTSRFVRKLTVVVSLMLLPLSVGYRSGHPCATYVMHCYTFAFRGGVEKKVGLFSWIHGDIEVMGHEAHRHRGELESLLQCLIIALPHTGVMTGTDRFLSHVRDIPEPRKSVCINGHVQ